MHFIIEKIQYNFYIPRENLNIFTINIHLNSAYKLSYNYIKWAVAIQQNK